MDAETAAAIRGSVAAEPYSYRTGILDGITPPGMSNDRLEVTLGSGDEVWRRARRALDDWQQFNLTWVDITTEGTAPRPGLEVLVSARRLGIGMLAACRVIETHDVQSSDMDRYGFSYGTLRSHIGRGEELFEVWREPATGRVGYTIHAMAAPGRWYSRLARPLFDHYRTVFRRDSGAAMRAAVQSTD